MESRVVASARLKPNAMEIEMLVEEANKQEMGKRGLLEEMPLTII